MKRIPNDQIMFVSGPWGSFSFRKSFDILSKEKNYTTDYKLYFEKIFAIPITNFKNQNQALSGFEFLQNSLKKKKEKLPKSTASITCDGRTNLILLSSLFTGTEGCKQHNKKNTQA